MSKHKVKVMSADTAVLSTAQVVVEDEPEIAPTQEAIARLAYSLWEARGCTNGSPEDDWLRAEEELKAKAQTA
jgi:hypothetical protein